MAKMKREQLYNEKDFDGYFKFFSKLIYCVPSLCAARLIVYLCDQKNGFWISTKGIQKATLLSPSRISEARKYLFEMKFLENPEEGVLRINYDEIDRFIFLKMGVKTKGNPENIVRN
jgi:hypothetical protein